MSSQIQPHDVVDNGTSICTVLYINPNVAEIFGPKALRSLYIRPSRNDCPFSRAHRMFNTLSSFKMLNPVFGGTDPIYTVLNSNFMQR